jgi:hypothetical protein
MNNKLPSALLKVMNTNSLMHKLIYKNRSMQSNKNLDKLAQEYRKLMVIQEPSEAQEERLQEILNLAIYDKKLNSVLAFVDKQLTEEMDIFEEKHSKEITASDNHDFFEETANSKNNGSRAFADDNLVFLHFPKVSSQTRNLQPIREPVKLLSVIVSLVGASIFGACFFGDEGRVAINSFSLFGTTSSSSKHQESLVISSPEPPDDLYQSVETSVLTQESYSNKTKVQRCRLNTNKSSQDILKYYSSVQALKQQAETKSLQPRELQREAEKLQGEAEKQQQEAEKQQREAEKQQREAEKQQQNALARQWQVKAQDSLEKSHRWFCIGQESLDLVKDSSIISKL